MKTNIKFLLNNSVFIFFIIFLFSNTSELWTEAKPYDIYQKALENMKSDNFEKAIEYLYEALQYYPNSSNEQISSIYWNLQACYFHLQNYTLAIQVCDKWIEKGGKFLGNAYYCLGLNYFYNNEFSKAIAAFSESLDKTLDVEDNSYNIIDTYNFIKLSYEKLGENYGWIPESKLWMVKIPSATWQYENRGKLCCLTNFSVRVENHLPVTIIAVNLNLILKDSKGQIIYKRHHSAWVNGLNTSEIAYSDYFALNNEVCLQCNYLDGQLNWTCEITGIAY